MKTDIRFNPPANWLQIRTIEMHTGGEPLRVLTEGLPEIKGNTILEKRRYFGDHFDYIRTGIMFEPRGHADMYGAIITPPTSKESDFGTFFMHNEGYSTMCGHATLALTKLAIEAKMVGYSEGQTIKIDAPPGQLKAKATLKAGKVVSSSFLNVPSFVLIKNEAIDVPGIGSVNFDVAYGGAFYAICKAEELGLSLIPSNYYRLLDYGKKIKKAVIENFDIRHPFEEDLSFLYGTIFTGKAKAKEHHSRNVCIFADGELDRSPTGSGISARAALHYSNGELNIGELITIESILGTTMDVSISEITQYGPFETVIPEVSGQSYFTGRNEFWFDLEDPLKNGFIFR